MSTEAEWESILNCVANFPSDLKQVSCFEAPSYLLVTWHEAR